MQLRMQQLVSSFLTLREAPGAVPWDPERLDTWATDEAEPESGGQHAARFVLSVWSGRKWRCGTFELAKAWAIWDADHRAACMAWLNSPWWP